MEPGPSLDPQPSRFVVGIDLGTTNSALAYVDTAEEPWRVRTFDIPQLVAPGTIETRETLPSFHYQRGAEEFPAGALRLPWSLDDPDYAVGVMARDHGVLVPGRLIASAKSWLCHSGVDRSAELLPWHGAPDVEKLSPVEASARYLAHLRSVWNARFADHPLEEQDVVLTLPASFDEVARELTVRSAARAGLPRVLLVEEPQAAFYAWINAQGADWERVVRPGQKILVCDIGGGTSDFTLLRVRGQADGKVRFHRVAVGEHLILGGDNLDLALAHHVERRLTGDGKLEPRAWSVLVQKGRQAKETLLAPNAPESLVVHLPGSGARLLGGGMQVELSRDEVRHLFFDGFLPAVPLDARPSKQRSGFREFGLPYAPDAAMTRYLAAFLTAHRHVALDESEDSAAAASDHDPARPDLVLFNGGFFASDVLRERLLDVLASWFHEQRTKSRWSPQVLSNERLDLAVAHGAAYYGMVRRGQGVRIAAGLARTYYLGVASTTNEPSAVCVVPAGIEEGTEIELRDRQFELRVREPVEFPLHTSATRLTDRPGELVPVDPEQMTSLPPIRTVLETGRQRGEAATLPVHLHARLTEIGTLEMWCAETSGPRRWRLQFDVRAATETDRRGHTGSGEQRGMLDEEIVAAARGLIERAFSASSEPVPPEGLMKRLAEAIGMPRADWPPSLLRSLWEAAAEIEAGRRRSAAHEARWLHLVGFALRPGYGVALDDWRVQQTWRLMQRKLTHASPTGRAEWWILWRRIAGGLVAGQQKSLAEPVLAELRAVQRAREKGRGGDFRPAAHEAAELWRALGAMELLNTATKEELGNLAIEFAAREKTPTISAAQLWALGRLGTRQPTYGPLNATIAPEVATKWARRIMTMKQEPETAALAVMQLTRRTLDRYRDVADDVRQQAIVWLERHGAPEHFVQLAREAGQLADEEQGLVFGESLPHGLRIL
ncbi:MAG TPA: Hsp70 family protein [Pirellulales bacterium]|nr:Hsp70 family protein [Pirellulales bacterium]